MDLQLPRCLEQVANGVVTGTIYALVGAGLTLVYGTMRVLISHTASFLCWAVTRC